ncbi:MAG: hypothetical protein Q4G36_02935 [Paracoccus sp. (in: a-proteobacteria)]|nr:hypothetical protein [Paracoccus sp. (in: a-proteobacteria)]
MSNPIEEQRLIIDQLYHIVDGSCPADATSARCRFRYDHGHEDGSESVTETFYFTVDGKSVSAALDRELAFPVLDLVPQLHAAMKAHTGGDWDAFTLFINEDGSVTTKFEYP